MPRIVKEHNTKRRGKPSRISGRAWILLLVIALMVRPFPAAADGGEPGDEVYIIMSQEDLAAIPTRGMNGHYKLGKDITLTGDWTPIGTAQNPFSGHLDGGGFSISGLSIQIDFLGDREHVGLFCYADGAVIENLTVSGASVQYSAFNAANRTGILLGYAKNTQIRNVSVSGSVSGMSVVGGLIGESGEGTVIGNSSTNVSVGYILNFLAKAAGGLAGILNKSEVHDSVVYGNTNIAYTDVVGGLAGIAESSVISGSRVEGSVSGEDKIGGLIAISADNKIQNSSALGDVTASIHYAGGLIAQSSGDTITDSTGIRKSQRLQPCRRAHRQCRRRNTDKRQFLRRSRRASVMSAD